MEKIGSLNFVCHQQEDVVFVAQSVVLTVALVVVEHASPTGVIHTSLRVGLDVVEHALTTGLAAVEHALTTGFAAVELVVVTVGIVARKRVLKL